MVRRVGMSLVLAVIILSLVLAACAPRPSPPATPTPRVTPTATATSASPSAPPLVVGLPSVVDVVNKVEPAVALIVVETTTRDVFGRTGQGKSIGSGVLFDAHSLGATDTGYILTNNHVVEGAQVVEGIPRITVILPDTRKFTNVRLIGRDPLTDLAVLKIEGKDLPQATLGDSDRLQVGEWVVAIGNALGLSGDPTVTVGVVSALGRSIPEPNAVTLYDLIQTDAAINPGNSGGPLINLRSEVVGINTAIAGGSEGIGFAVSMATAKPIVQELLAKGEVAWPWMGVSVASVTPGMATEDKLPVDEGVIVQGVPRGGPAAAAGLAVGDIIIRLDGRLVANVRQLQEAIRTHQIGDTVEVVFLRGGKEQKASVTLEKMPRGL